MTRREEEKKHCRCRGVNISFPISVFPSLCVPQPPNMTEKEIQKINNKNTFHEIDTVFSVAIIFVSFSSVDELNCILFCNVWVFNSFLSL